MPNLIPWRAAPAAASPSNRGRSSTRRDAAQACLVRRPHRGGIGAQQGRAAHQCPTRLRGQQVDAPRIPGQPGAGGILPPGIPKRFLRNRNGRAADRPRPRQRAQLVNLPSPADGKTRPQPRQPIEPAKRPQHDNAVISAVKVRRGSKMRSLYRQSFRPRSPARLCRAAPAAPLASRDVHQDCWG